MPLTKKFSEMYDDALTALAAASQRPANVVNVEGHYAIRVDLEYNRYVLATNAPRGLWDEPDASNPGRCVSFKPVKTTRTRYSPR